MQNFSAQTRLTPNEIMNRAYRHFVETCGLVLIARVMHLHGAEGAVQIEVAGARLVGGKGSHDARKAFDQIVAHVRGEYGLTPIFTLLHLHAVQEDDAGHVLVQIDFGVPGRVLVETETYERETKEFLNGLPG